MAELMSTKGITSLTEQVAAQDAAQAAGLHYISDTLPGIRRQQHGKGFRYLNADGQPLRTAETLRRIKSLAIPPAWTDVWICPLPDGHVQATGRDAKGRKQYRYHPRWHALRDETKYDRLIAFGQALTEIRACTERDLVLPGLPRAKVLATVVRLLETTCIRVGNEEYARANRSYGLTTLRVQHVRINGATLRFQFRGKSGVRHAIDLHDRRLAKIVKRCQELPGQELFQYLDDDGQRQSIGSADVNAYLREITGEDFTAKDFRTWVGTVQAATALGECKACDTHSEMEKNLVHAIESVAARLGNTKAVCRKSYVHPEIIELYREGLLLNALKQHVEAKLCKTWPLLRPEERSVLAILRCPRAARRKRAATI